MEAMGRLTPGDNTSCDGISVLRPAPSRGCWPMFKPHKVLFPSGTAERLAPSERFESGVSPPPVLACTATQGRPETRSKAEIRHHVLVSGQIVFAEAGAVWCVSFWCPTCCAVPGGHCSCCHTLRRGGQQAVPPCLFPGLVGEPRAPGVLTPAARGGPGRAEGEGRRWEISYGGSCCPGLAPKCPLTWGG